MIGTFCERLKCVWLQMLPQQEIVKQHYLLSFLKGWSVIPLLKDIIKEARSSFPYHVKNSKKLFYHGCLEGSVLSGYFTQLGTFLSWTTFFILVLKCFYMTYLQMCLGHSPLLLRKRTEPVKSGTGSSRSLDWCSDSLRRQIEDWSVQK